MNIKGQSLRLWWRRGTLFKSLSVATCCVLISAIWLVTPTISQMMRHVSPRLGYFDSSNVDIILKIPHLTKRQRIKLQRVTPGAPLHQIQPQLRLVGLLEEVKDDLNSTNSDKGAQLTIGVFHSQVPSILREDSQFHLYFQSPSLSLLLEDLLHSDRGRSIQRHIRSRFSSIKQRGQELIPVIETILKRHVTPKNASRILKDPVLHSQFKIAFQREVQSKIHLESIGRELLRSKEFQEFQEFSMQGIEAWPLVWSSIEVAFDHAWTAPSMFKEWRWLNPIDSMKKAKKRGVNKTKEGIHRGMRSSMKKIAKQIFRNVKKDPNQTVKNIKAIVKSTDKKAKISQKLSSFASRLFKSKTLRAHVVTTYGPKVWKKFKEAIRELSRDETFLSWLKYTGKQLKALGRSILKCLLLDREGQGPNPLLLVVIQEQLKGQIEPVIHVIPGKGEAVSEHFEFTQSKPRPLRINQLYSREERPSVDLNPPQVKIKLKTNTQTPSQEGL